MATPRHRVSIEELGKENNLEDSIKVRSQKDILNSLRDEEYHAQSPPRSKKKKSEMQGRTGKDYMGQDESRGNGQSICQEDIELEMENSMIRSSVRKKSAKYAASTEECPLCLESEMDEEFVIFTKCDHKFCVKCSIRQIKEQIENNNEVRCPMKGCGALMDAKASILSYLTEDELEKVNYIQSQANLKESSLVERDVEVSIEQDEDPRKKQDHPQFNQPQKMVQMSSSPSKGKVSDVYVSNEYLDEKQSNLKKSRFKEEGQKEIEKSNQVFPKKIFLTLCAQIWSNKWSKFLKMLPISILILILVLLLLTVWVLLVALYFTCVWLVFVPVTWAIYQIWGCFSRSFENIYARTLLFVLCLLGFPLLFCFFYILTLGVIFWKTLFKSDMYEVMRGRSPIVLSCGKVHLHRTQSVIERCKCKAHERCFYCQNRNTVLCFVL